MPGNRTVTTLVEGLSFAEGPRWHQGRLWVSDFYTQSVLAVDESGKVETQANIPNQPSGIGFLPGGDALIVSMRDRKLIRRAGNGQLSEYADLSALTPWFLNDMLVDDKGRAWVGNFGWDLMGGTQLAATILIRVDPDGKAEVAADNLVFPNGTVIPANSNTLIVAQSFGHELTAFDIGDDGQLTNRRAWASFGEPVATTDVHEYFGAANCIPDGMCIDAENAIWVADAGGNRVVRVAQGGKILEEISTGDMGAYACMLGGKDGRTLFICSCPTFVESEIHDKRLGTIKTARVDVPHAGQP